VATIHFLNVKDGDCSVIEHNSGHASVIDVCNAKPPDPVAEVLLSELAKAERGISGNFQQKKYPVNPITYLRGHDTISIFRYIQTHPDMDHMDGIRTLFDEFSPLNLWDTDNTKEMPKSAWEGSPYNEADWKFYKDLRDMKPEHDPKRLGLLSGAHGQYYNVGADGSAGGDGLHVLAPTQELVDAANEADEEYNRCSYVILYRTGKNRIVFGGDSHDETWDHILDKHKRDVTGIDLLIAPHHGRKSGRSYEFLDTLKPTLTFFGNARSEHLAYDAWGSRGLSIITNNQANCMLVDASVSPMTLYVTHENFARQVSSGTFYSDAFQAWYVGPITEDLIP
jgi:beta-lactamase superfamily II metal-dependent hydrolase